MSAMDTEDKNDFPKLQNNEILRYSRQLLLPEFGVKSQLRLKASSALIVGCGGLGCPAAIYLAAAGIGILGLLDHDEVEVTNLHRQILHKESMAGAPKCQSAQYSCQAINSLVTYRLHHVAITSANAMDLVSQYDVILDCTDNVATRYLVNDACVLSGKPLISGAALKFEGQLTVYNYNGGPCYRCLYPTPPPAHTVTSCSEGGVLGVIPGIIGTMQAQEAIKVVAGLSGVLSGRLFLYDGLSFMTRVVRLRPKQESCAVCGTSPSIHQLIDYVQFCGAAANDKQHRTNPQGDGLKRLSPTECAHKIKAHTHLVIDTRPAHEFEICSLPDSINIELATITAMDQDGILSMLQQHLPTSQYGSNIDSKPSVIFVCHHGNDSQVAAQHCRDLLGESTDIFDLAGGLDSYSIQVNSNFPRY